MVAGIALKHFPNQLLVPQLYLEYVGVSTILISTWFFKSNFFHVTRKIKPKHIFEKLAPDVIKAKLMFDAIQNIKIDYKKLMATNGYVKLDKPQEGTCLLFVKFFQMRYFWVTKGLLRTSNDAEQKAKLFNAFVGWGIIREQDTECYYKFYKNTFDPD